MVRAIWIPGWYELDPSLAVGRYDEFAFWRFVPADLHCSESLVFYNTIMRPGDAVFATGKIIAIRHADLGRISQIDARGLDYTICLENGTRFLVNAEEEPGRIYDAGPNGWIESERIVSDWRCEVVFESLSELTAESTR